MTSFSIQPRGAFSLRESVEFGFGQRRSAVFDGAMGLAFCVDGYAEQVGVAVRQDGAGGVHGDVHGDVHGEVLGEAPLDLVRAQTARLLSLDVDATGYEDVCARDPVVARIVATAPGLRPPLFHSPYEAAAWCVLSQRWNARQAAAVRERVSREHGRVFDVAGNSVAAFPTPAKLLELPEFPGVPDVKMARLRAVAQAAVDGALDAETLRASEPEEALSGLREIPGIGTFSAALILLRSSGVTDAPVDAEPRLAEIVGRLYGLQGAASSSDLLRIAEAWRPFRTWVAVLLRAAADRVPDERPATADAT